MTIRKQHIFSIWPMVYATVTFFACPLLLSPLVAGEEKPALLFVNGGGEAGASISKDNEYIKKLGESGFTVDVIGSSDLTWEKAKLFNAMIFPLAGGMKNFTILRQFLQNKGGIFVMDGGATWGLDLPMNDFLKPLGAEILEEMVIEKDSAAIWRQENYYQQSFALTREIEPSPVTEGIKSLWYPFRPLCNGQYSEATLAFKAGPLWQIPVRGSETANSIKITPHLNMNMESFSKEPSATYKTKPPLLAVSEQNGGRLALMCINQSYLTVDGYHFMWEKIVLEKGNGKVPSDWNRLLNNAYRWLAAPSLTAHTLGGYQAATNKEDIKWPKPIDWTKVTIPPENESTFWHYRYDNKQYHHKGLIGIHTALSDGTGTVAEYVAKAKALQYRWVVFTEEYTAMDEEKWSRLVKQCADLSSPDFRAVPGLALQDPVGNHFLLMGNYPFPKKEWAKPKRFSIISDIFYTYAQPPVVLYNLANNQFPHPRFNQNFHGFGVYTYKNGKLIDSSLKEYLCLQRAAYFLYPLAIHLIYSPDELNEALAGTQHTVFMSKDLSEFPKCLQGGGGQKIPNRIYVSDGPRIPMCGIANDQPYSRTVFGQGVSPDKFRYPFETEGTGRWRYFFSAEDEQQLKEINVIDDEKTHWSFKPEPGKPFVAEIDGYHTKQQGFVIQAKNDKGQTAISSAVFPFTYFNWLINCSDQRNIIPHGNGHYRVFSEKKQPGGFENYYTYYDQLGWNIRGLKSIVWQGFSLQTKEPMQQLSPPYHEIPRVCGKDIMVFDQMLEYTYPPALGLRTQKPSGNTNSTLARTKDIEGYMRVQTFTPRCGMHVTLYETVFTFKRDVTLTNSHMNPVWGTLSEVGATYNCPGDARQVAYTGLDGILRTEKPGKKFSAPLPKNGFVALYPNLAGAGAIYPLQDNIGFETHFNERYRYITIGVWDNPQKTYKKGDKISIRYLMVYNYRKFANPDPVADFEWLRKTMGLAGKPAYQVYANQGAIINTEYILEWLRKNIGLKGKPAYKAIINTEYILDLQARQYGFDGVITKANIPEFLPVRITGLNDNWAAGFWDRTDNHVEPIAVQDNIGYAQIDIRRRDVPVYIGNLLVCDNPQIRLDLILDEKQQFIQANNPLPEEITTTIRTPDKFKEYLDFSRKITLPAGSLLKIPVQPKKLEWQKD